MIKSLYVEKFRALKKIHIPLGKKVTVIAGQNATCKSTLLGMIGQPFGLKNEKTIFGKPFSTKFSDIFKFSKVYDVPGEHEYQIHFYDDTLFGKEVEYVKSYKRAPSDTSHIRLVVGKTRDKGDGNLDFPVVYLGLKRVYPIGELRDITESIPTLTQSEVELYNKWYKSVFFPLENINPIQISAKQQKDTLAVNSDRYDYFANSAGQDNIGQIIGAIFSFMRLKNKLGGKYKGGIILLDELDATLFPRAQKNLIDLFYKVAGKFSIQFVFTTHSLDALEHIIEDRQHNNGDTEVLYFTNVHGKLELIKAPLMQRIRSDMNMTTIPDTQVAKVNVYCEDPEATLFTKRLLGAKRTKNLNFSSAAFSGDLLNELAKKNIPEFRSSIIVLDGDKSPSRTSPNVLVLPGNHSPENVFRTLLESLPPDHSFWRNKWNYTKQVFESELATLTQGQYQDRVKMKKWFNDQKRYWGKGINNIYKCWLELNMELAEEFCKKFDRIYVDIARRRSIPL